MDTKMEAAGGHKNLLIAFAVALTTMSVVILILASTDLGKTNSIQEGQSDLIVHQYRLHSIADTLHAGQQELLDEVDELEDGQKDLQEDFDGLQEDFDELKEGFDELKNYMLANFGGVRLVDDIGSGSPKRGRVEILYAGEWGSICRSYPYYWGTAESRIVCEMLGYGYNSYKYGDRCTSDYGTGDGKIWLDGVDCTGSESNLYECKHSDWGSVSCSHSDAICVCCS